MGCTSSAPKLTTSRTNSEADSEQVNSPLEAEDNIGDISKDVKTASETDVANVLPKTCDNLVDLTELDRNKSIFDILKPDQENDLQSNKQEMLTNKLTVDDKEGDINHHSEDKLSTLEEVVEKVVDLYVADRCFQSSNAPSSSTHDTCLTEYDSASGANNTNDTELLTDEPEPIETKSVACETEASAGIVGPYSPSESQTSRATRWEALADVAAELPPSLAVDPLTGQIYALSK